MEGRKKRKEIAKPVLNQFLGLSIVTQVFALCLIESLNSNKLV